MGRIDEAGNDVVDRAETDADALEAIEREERMLERTGAAARDRHLRLQKLEQMEHERAHRAANADMLEQVKQVKHGHLDPVVLAVGAGQTATYVPARTPPAGIPVVELAQTFVPPREVATLVEWIVKKRNLLDDVRARLPHMSPNQVVAALEALRTYPNQTLDRAGSDPAFTPEMAQLHVAMVNVKHEEERSEARLKRRAHNKQQMEKARELLFLAISLDGMLETDASRKMFHEAVDVLEAMGVAP